MPGSPPIPASSLRFSASERVLNQRRLLQRVLIFGDSDYLFAGGVSRAFCDAWPTARREEEPRAKRTSGAAALASLRTFLFAARGGQLAGPWVPRALLSFPDSKAIRDSVLRSLPFIKF